MSEEDLVHNRGVMHNHKFGKRLKFYTYLNDVKGFSPYIDELKKYIFKLKSKHITHAKERLSEFSVSMPTIIQTLTQSKNKTKMVSIHVRLGDYDAHLKRLFDLPPVPDDYLSRAMELIAQQNNLVGIIQYV